MTPQKATALLPRRTVSIRSLIVSVAATAVLTSLLWLSIMEWRSAENPPTSSKLGLRAVVPEHVSVGQPFDLELVLENHQKDKVLLRSLEVDDMVFKGAAILSIKPEPFTSFEGFSVRIFKFGGWLERGTTKITFRLQADTKRSFKGEVTAWGWTGDMIGRTLIEFQAD